MENFVCVHSAASSSKLKWEFNPLRIQHDSRDVISPFLCCQLLKFLPSISLFQFSHLTVCKTLEIPYKSVIPIFVSFSLSYILSKVIFEQMLPVLCNLSSWRYLIVWIRIRFLILSCLISAFIMFSLSVLSTA